MTTLKWAMNCLLASLVCAFTPALASSTMTSAQIGMAGGKVSLGSSRVTILPGTFPAATTVMFSQLQKPPVPIPPSYTVLGVFRLTTSRPLHYAGAVVHLAGFPRPTTADDVTEVYVLENNDWVIGQMGGTNNTFELPEADVFPDAGQPDVAPIRTYVITRTSLQSLKRRLAASGGSYNGVYGECPEGTAEYFGTCRIIASP
ncbi:hypothetical protein [Deinococcus ruber]|uniref:Uncharacterized protein n=1 Tax=Deinococcus ruber TaxID=1848197 RepID=A0A918F7G1_9DEIO|nr:hypothetical protein [Deinococcus ruber]GGR16271.1 hypothetical protein GCM10008957_31140 [Deinococcus ruber]